MTIDEKIEDIIKGFDFQRVYDLIQREWLWMKNKSISQLKDDIRSSIKYLYDLKWSSISTDGFIIMRTIFDGVETVHLYFTVEESYNFFETEEKDMF